MFLKPRCRPLPGARCYKYFLTLWKDTDPDFPILKQGEDEYAKLQ
jgi:hypothetical protein